MVKTEGSFNFRYVKRSYYLILKCCTALSSCIAVDSSGRRRGSSGVRHPRGRLHRRRCRVVVVVSYLSSYLVVVVVVVVVSYSYEWGVQRQFFLPHPLEPWGGVKRSNII